jgi:galactose mutarotase-like enzyme
MYPFGFRLSVEYVLQGGKVEIRYGVHAKVDNQAPMFFSIGNHIAFNTPLIPGGDPAAMTLETPSTIELLRDDITMPTGESRPRSHAEPFAIGEWEVLRAVSLSGYAGDPYVVLRDPGGFAIRMSHHASQLPEQPFVQYNVWGDARGGYFSTEPAVGLQNSFVLGQGLINLEPGQDFDWTISIELER